MDDHGTLRDEAGEPLAYRVCEWPLPNVPLMESQIWPEDMLLVSTLRNGRVVKVEPRPGQRTEAEWYAARIERDVARRLGFVACRGEHDWGSVRCVECGAVR